MQRLISYYKDIQPILVVLSGIICTFFDSTLVFLIALAFGFTFNIIAGFRADEVKIKLWRICNFKGNKLKDSLTELFLIVMVTYFLKLLADLMGYSTSSFYIVHVLIAMALYYYVRNGLRNLCKAYPKSRWLRFVYIIIGFKFAELAPESVKKAWNKSKNKEDGEQQ